MNDASDEAFTQALRALIRAALSWHNRRTQDTPIVGVYRMPSWEMARNLAGRLGSWVFRGQADAKWGLSTAIERHAIRLGCPLEILWNREEWILKQFERRAHHYMPSPPAPEQRVEWLSIIQHHGGPTRLLDFTHSFYVAAFFALHQAVDEAAVWAVNNVALRTLLSEKVNLTLGQGETVYDFNRKCLNFAENYIGTSMGERIVVAVEPERLNARLAAQQGTFLFPGDVTVGFEQNLASMFNMDTEELNGAEVMSLSLEEIERVDWGQFGILKLIIPMECRYVAMMDLASMNVNSATLFPDLDGFARSLVEHLRMAEMNPEMLEEISRWREKLASESHESSETASGLLPSDSDEVQ